MCGSHVTQCIFKLYDDFYPGLAKEPHDEHEAHHEMMKNINSLLTALKANPTPAAAQELATQLAKYGEVSCFCSLFIYGTMVAGVENMHW